MGPDKLECLLDFFIANRLGEDTVDGISTNLLNIAVQNDPIKSASGFVQNNPIKSASGVAVIPECSNTAQSAQFANIGKRLADLANQYSRSQQNDSCCVKFEKSCIIVSPEEQTISLTLIRYDTYKDTVTKLTWKTQDKTAVSGTHYIASSGEVVFDKGVMKKTIQIKILETLNDTLDLRFHIKLSVLDEGFDSKFMTVAIKKIDDFNENERQVVESLPSSAPFTVEAIRNILDISLNQQTFHMALTHLCSAADSVHLEFALALDLSRLCFPKLRRSSVVRVLEDFFRTEDIEDM